MGRSAGCRLVFRLPKQPWNKQQHLFFGLGSVLCACVLVSLCIWTVANGVGLGFNTRVCRRNEGHEVNRVWVRRRYRGQEKLADCRLVYRSPMQLWKERKERNELRRAMESRHTGQQLQECGCVRAVEGRRRRVVDLSTVGGSNPERKGNEETVWVLCEACVWVAV